MGLGNNCKKGWDFKEKLIDLGHNSNNAVLKSIEKLHSDMLYKFNLLDRLSRKIIFLQFYHSRELSGEDHAEQAKSARRRTREFMEDMDNDIK